MSSYKVSSLFCIVWSIKWLLESVSYPYWIKFNSLLNNIIFFNLKNFVFPSEWDPLLEGPSSYVINRHRWSVLDTRIEFKMLDVYLILQGESEDENKIFDPQHFRSKKRSDQKTCCLHHSDPDVLSRHLFIVEQRMIP